MMEVGYRQPPDGETADAPVESGDRFGSTGTRILPGRLALLAHTAAWETRPGRVPAQQRLARATPATGLCLARVLGPGALALQPAGAPRLLPSPRPILLAIRAEIRTVVGRDLGPRQRATYGQRRQRARGDSRRRRAHQVRRPWPGRTPYRPPGAPKILKMGSDLQRWMEKTLGVVE